MQKLIQMKSIVKKYNIGSENELTILKGIDLEVKSGEFLAIVGASGSGKSTLMNIIGLLDRPTEGTYILEDRDVSNIKDDQLSQIRNQKIGFVFQSFNLIPRISAQKNVELPMMYSGMSPKLRSQRALELLDRVSMKERANHRPNELSGGQQQRVAIARAMANDPGLILADEPTGALDTKTGRAVMDLFHDLNKKESRTIVLITHNPELAEEAGRVITMVDGRIE